MQFSISVWRGLVLAAMVWVFTGAEAVLSRSSKQTFLDLHNYHRARNRINQIVWSEPMAVNAQTIASRCDPEDAHGRNYYYNISAVPGRLQDTLPIGQINTNYMLSILQPLDYSRTTAMGCGHQRCPKLFLDNGRSVLDTDYYVCHFTPLYYRTTETSPDDSCPQEPCPSSTPHCVTFTSTILTVTEQLNYCASSQNPPLVPADMPEPVIDRVVTNVVPRSGSLAGGTRLTITGRGFSSNMYNGGNTVTLKRDSLAVSCVIETHRTSTGVITCVTGPVPFTTGDHRFLIEVKSSDGNAFQTVRICPWCTFTYKFWFTPFLQRLDPPELACGTTVTLSGRLYASTFSDPDAIDPSLLDVFSRILAGRSLCSPTTENGTMYGSTSDTRGLYTSIDCLPVCRVASMNVTAILARRGNSLAREQDYVCSIDNNLRPYCLQIYADIQSVFPMQGSLNGGTRLNININPNHTYNSSDIKVMVGGVPCVDVASNFSEGSYIQCTTGPMNCRNNSLFPGHRGVQVEVYPDYQTFSNLRNLPHSQLLYIHSSLHFHQDNLPSLGLTQNTFSLRASGYFVPPKTSLYTFNILSVRGESQLYLDCNSSEEALIASSRQQPYHGWNRTQSQLSSPVLLQESVSCKFTLLARVYYRPRYFLGVGAKLHALPHTSHPYVGDRELQKITISSTVVREKQLVSVEALPQIQELKVYVSSNRNYEATPGNGSGSTATSCSSFNVSISIDGIRLHVVAFDLNMTPEQIQSLLNRLNAIRSIGKISVKRDNITLSTTFIFLSRANSYNIPQLQLDSEYITLSCVNSSTNYTLMVSLVISQNLTLTEGFYLGYNNTGSVRFTPPLPLNVSHEDVEEEMNELLKWSCEYPMPSPSLQILYNNSFENGNFNNLDNSTAYCGGQSSRNPEIVWEDSAGLRSHHTVCFAFRGDFPGMTLGIRYPGFIPQGANGQFAQVDINTTFNIDTTDVQNPEESKWSRYTCLLVTKGLALNDFVMEDLMSRYSECLQGNCRRGNAIFSNLQFNSSDNFWVDELYIARQVLNVTRLSSPLTSNGVDITRIDVEGGTLLDPVLIDRPKRTLIANMHHETNYTMEISKYFVSFTVSECGFGLEILSGHYKTSTGTQTEVLITQVDSGSMPVGGMFSISMANKSLSPIPFNISASGFQLRLELNYPAEGMFSVVRSGSCTGYSWEIEWRSRGGDRAQIETSGSDLTGTQVNITTTTLRDGGVWLRPIRGDMLRTVANEPQVDVIIDGVPSSCSNNGSCSFQYTAQITPTLLSISPNEGQEGTTITINGTNFTSNVDLIRIFIGRAECNVTWSSTTSLTCIASSHMAGFYQVRVFIQGIGFASGDACFLYLLYVTGISPSDGSIIGGYEVTITGRGFLELSTVTVSNFPWIHYGIGLPQFNSLQELYLCPSELIKFEDSIRDLAKDREGNVINRKTIEEKFRNRTLSAVFGNVNQTAEALNLTCDFDISNFLSFANGAPYLVQFSVFIGEYPCLISQSTKTSITCTVTFATPPTPSVNVSVFSQTISIDNAFMAMSDFSPTIESLSPKFSPVTGGGRLTIKGDGFNSSQLNSSGFSIGVYVGRTLCKIEHVNNTCIICIPGAHAPGHYRVYVITRDGVAITETIVMDLLDPSEAYGDLGWSSTSINMSVFPIHEYRLFKNISSSIQGSVAGGTEVIIEGGIFVSGQTQVRVGGVPANIRSLRDNELVVITPSSTKTVLLNFNVILLDTDKVVMNYNENKTTVQVGDTVVWTWNIRLPQSIPINVQLYLTGPPESSFAKINDTNFGTSDPNYNSSASTYRFSFLEPGIYFYAIESNFDNTQILHGMITVTDLVSSLRRVDVYVNQFLAEDVMPNASKIPNGCSKYQENRKMIIEIDNCSADSTLMEQSSSYFFYSTCHTPVVMHVTPQQGVVSETMFTIQGKGFSTTPSDNIVKFGVLPCAVSSSTNELIHCSIQINETRSSLPMAAWMEYPLSLRVTENNTGFPIITNATLTYVEILPHVTHVSPSFGSLQGGTDIVISGTAFSFIAEPKTGLPCRISTMNPTEIICTTLPADTNNEDLTYNVSICIDRSGEKLCVDTNFTFTYSRDHTPNVTSISIDLANIEMTIFILRGFKFSTVRDWNDVRIHNQSCNITSFNQSHIVCSVPALPASSYQFSFIVCNSSSNRCLGYAQIHDDYKNISIHGIFANVNPSSGSIHGGTEITLEGSGFHRGTYPFLLNITIGSSPCRVRSVNFTRVKCVTTPPQSVDIGNPQDVYATVDGVSLVADNITFTFSQESTPSVSEITPSSGQLGDIINITGALLGRSRQDATVEVGGSGCGIYLADNSTIQCSLGVNFAGRHPISIHIHPYGFARIATGVTFEYRLIISNLSVTEGSFAGGNVLTVYGAGFDPSDTQIRICDNECIQTSRLATPTQIECTVPLSNTTSMSNLLCNVTLQSLGKSAILAEAYNYSLDLTPTVTSLNRTRGGTAGGSAILITGHGFTGNAQVIIAGTNCSVEDQQETAITCITGASSRTIRSRVMVLIAGKGFAMSSAEFWYVDLWSSPFTWKDLILPAAGDFVVVPKGQTLVLDVVTPILSLVVIQGGQLIFDIEASDNQVALHTQRLLIVSKGRLEIGTEQEPFLSRTEVVLYGHRRSTELPVFGTKNIALREGEISVSGRPINITWTRLISTVLPGATTLYLRDWVPWKVNGSIVIASTSFSQRENEVRIIQSIYPGPQGSILNVTEALNFEHISVQQLIAGRTIDTSAEVGYLTRNVLFRGNRNEEWSESIQACNEEFRTGQFEVQTCFQGRFGSEEGSDQFGGHIMIHAAVPNSNDVKATLAYAEFTHFGQAFRLGRYPIHFHLSGNVSGSYVRGCSIHHTFNRAVTIHAVDYLLVENNVAYNILGHAYFFEDGNEQQNTVQGNLGVFVRASSSLLNVDITPATYWVVNANNIIRKNAAAGGTHFGFWYRIPKNPTGPSFTPSMCPIKQRVLEFSDNSAHSFGWYGLWVFPEYTPTVTGGCGDNTHAPSYYDRLLAWRNDRGIEVAHSGSIQVRDSIMLDNKLAGIEYTDMTSVWGENGPLITDTLVIGHSQISDDDLCTESGIKTPGSYYLTVSNVTFVNFDRPGCSAVQACSQCKFMQGGFETRYEKISFKNVTNLTRWQWEHEHVHRDLDGTLTRTGEPSLLIPTSNLLDTNECKIHPESSSNILGSICNGSLKFGRIGISNPTPSSLLFTSLNITNELGTSKLLYISKRITGGPGYMALVKVNPSSNTGYLLTWIDGRSFTNISYSILTSGFSSTDYITLTQNYPQPLDMFEVRGAGSASNLSSLDELRSASTGSHILYNNDTTLSYVIRGSRSVTFSTYKCFYNDCIVPEPPTETLPEPPTRSNNSLLWSRNSSWPDNRVPGDGEDVTISGVYMLLDVPRVRCGRLDIVGATLEVMDGEDRVLEVTYIIIRGGRLVAGYPDTPFRARLRIILHGSNTSPELRLGSSPPVGGRSIAVFGDLILNAPPRVGRTWSILSTTADKGSLSLSLIHSVDWSEGDEIVVTSTSYDAYQSEVARIRSISNNRMLLQLNSSLKYTHMGRASAMGYFGAEVGLLSRRIVIENGDPELATRQSFGSRVLVTQSFPNLGRTMLRGVEFRGCGQLGYTDDFNPRFALVFLNLQLPGTSSNVTECSFHSGYNTAIGVLNSNNILIEDNVVHGTVGASMRLKGSGLQVTQNLASLAQYIGLFQNVIEKDNPAWTANYDLDTSTSTDVTFQYNSAAGGAMACFHLNGEYMSGDSFSIAMSDNIGHSCLHGVHLGYTDGYSLGSEFKNFTLSFCYYFGFFSYSPASIFISNSVFISNKAAIYVSVIGPPSLRHIVGDSIVRIENTEIISTINQTNRCNDSDPTAAIPPIVAHQNSDGIESPSGGHVGIVIPSFVSGHGSFPHGSWYSVTSYPAINGSTWVTNVTFNNFESYCGGTKKDVLFITNPSSEDANHPVYLRSITEQGGNNGSLKVYIHPPRIGRVNPSDCVDMYCDGMKNVLLKDLDGSYTGLGSLHSIIPLAELNWDGADRRAGIGDYRIPVEMLTDADGSRINVNTLYPKKGIIRGESFGREDDCSFVTDWNAYICSKLNHMMLVVESLDADTEVRRLSPISYGANGFVNLVNGPMDNGWCGGYTCQERISTFYVIVAEGFNYTMALTSTNPQNMALHLLHAADDQAITIAIIYTNPQRLDVHVSENGVDRYVVPNNAYYDGDNIKYRSGEASQFIPSLDIHGSNFYDRKTKQLHVTLRGKLAIKIITTPVIMVSLTLSVNVNDFFDEGSLIKNLAFHLGIPDSRIRVVSISRETGTPSNRRRKRQASTPGTIAAVIEIGDLPQSNISKRTNISSLSHTTDDVVNVVQSSLLNVTVASFSLTRPQPPAVDPTGGVRATPETGGPQPSQVPANSTLSTFYSRQLMMEQELSMANSSVESFTVPCRLVATTISSGAIEGLRLPLAAVPTLSMLNCDGTLSERLGLDIPWSLSSSATVKPDSAFLTNTIANFSVGRARFEDLIFSHPGSYQLYFMMSYPTMATFSLLYQSTITVLERQLGLVIVQQPKQGNITFPLYPYPTVHLVDTSNGNAVVSDHTWRNTTWFVQATILGNQRQQPVDILLHNGIGTFTNIHILSPGNYYLEIYTYQSMGNTTLEYRKYKIVSQTFEIVKVPVLRFLFTYNIDYGVIRSRKGSFLSMFNKAFKVVYPNLELINSTAREGTVIVSVYVTSTDRKYLIQAMNDINRGTNPEITFVFDRINFTPANVEVDHSVKLENGVNNLEIILPVVFGIIIFFAIVVAIPVSLYLYKHGFRSSHARVYPHDLDDTDMTQMIPYPPPSYSDTSLVYKQKVGDDDDRPSAPEPTQMGKEKITLFWKVEDLH